MATVACIIGVYAGICLVVYVIDGQRQVIAA